MGDIIDTLAGLIGAKKAVQAVERRTGKSCGCAARRQALNEKFPNSANESIDGKPK